MPRIQANRDAIDDRFSVLGFTVRSESPLFEIGVATDPALFQADHKAARSRRNFFSSRSAGVLRARRGEAVYLLPPDVMANFVGQPRLYFGLATYRENSKGAPDSVQAPSSGNMYVNLSGLTERGLRRLVTSARVSSYGQVNGRDASLEWGGDAWPQMQTSPAANGNGNGNSATPGTPQVIAPAPYDDGFGQFPSAATDNNTGPRVQTRSGAEPVPAAPRLKGENDASGTNGATGAPASAASPATPATAQALRHAAPNPTPRPLYGMAHEAGDMGTSERHGAESGPTDSFDDRGATAHSAAARYLLSRAQEVISPFYDATDPASALTCQNNAFSLAMEEWFMGVDNTRMFPHSAICKLTMTAPDGSLYGGTGFYIGRNRILTCAHNLHGMTQVVVAPGSNAAGDAPYGRCTIQSAGWRVAPAYTGTGDWAHDLAVIDNAPIAAPLGRWFKFLNATPSTRMPIVVCGYSAQSYEVPALTQVIDGERQHLHGGYAAEQSGFDVIEYALLTLAGASGSPVYHLSEDRNGQLDALVTAVHVTGEPAAKGLNRGCFLTPQKLDWIEGRTTSFALGATARALGAISIHWDDVPSYPQTSPASCWAASAAMVVGWRDRVSIPDSEIARRVPAIDAYRSGLWPSDRRQLADAWNLVAEPPASYTLEAWAQMLQAYGPLYIDMTWSGTSGGHVRVLVGMESDGSPDGSGTTMFMHDPWPDTPGRIKLPFADFLELYENRTGNSGGQLLYQILHADRLPDGVQPVTAAPFALTLASEAEPASDDPAPTTIRLAPAPAPIAGGFKAVALAQGALAAKAVETVVVEGIKLLIKFFTRDAGKLELELDNLEGWIGPNGSAQSEPTAAVKAGETIEIKDWPRVVAVMGIGIRQPDSATDRHVEPRMVRVDDDTVRAAGDPKMSDLSVYANVAISWAFDGKAVGNINIDPMGSHVEDDFALKVEGRIRPEPHREGESRDVAKVLVRFIHSFNGPGDFRSVGYVDVRLFGSGERTIDFRWK